VPEKVGVEDEAVIPIKVVGNRPIVPVSIGTRVVQVLLDTGDWGSGVLSGATAHEVELSSAPLPGLGAGSVWGPVEVEFAEAERLGIGSFELVHVPLLVAPKGWYNMGPSTDSVIGYDVLSQFTVRIDYPRQRLWLRRRPNAEITYGGLSYALQRRAGLLAYRRPMALQVAAIFPDSPAAHLGIRPGDRLVPPLGEDTTNFDSKTLETIVTGGEVTVARRINGVWVDVPLPSGLPDAKSSRN
jgi:hypothetical protein